MEALLALVFSVSFAAVLGWLRDLSIRLREELSERKTAEEALRNAQDTLEQRVAERTTDLQAANEQLRREITERKRTEEALRESEEKWRSFTNNTNDSIQILDTEGKILYMNKVYPPHNLEDVIGRSVLEFMDGESKEITKKSIENLLRDKIPQDCEVKILLTEFGSSLFEVKFVPHFLNEEVDKIIAHVSNIDERKQAEEALRESEGRYRELVENAVLGIFRTTQGGKFIMANQRMADIFGYDSQQHFLAEADNIIKLYANPEERPMVLKEIDEKGHIDGKEGNFKRMDGSPIFCNAYVRSIQRKDGETIYEGLLEDITEQKSLQDQLQQAQKIEAIGTLAGGIAHDFNNILMAILGHADIAKMKLVEDSEAIDNLNQLKNAGERARRLIQQILAFGRMGEQEMIPLSLTPLIREALKFLRSTLPTSIEIRDYIEADPGIIEADATQIHQIMMNLCTNAGHAMQEEGGTLDVRLIGVEVE